MSHGEFSDAPTVSRRKLNLATLSQSFLLTVVDGPDVGEKFAFSDTEPRTLLGKSLACGARLADPEVSRRHVALEVKGVRLIITDLGSTNGTLVNGVSIRQAELVGGETLIVGRTTFRVEAVRAAEPGTLGTETRFGRVLGASEAMRRIYPLCRRFADSSVPLIIEGETGTGKELLVEAIHEQGSRRGEPYVVFDCTAVAPRYIEAELFGHEVGAVSRAGPPPRGVFERANGGTLLIDEIGDLPLEHQPRLLRALERLEITRVGGGQPVRLDVRVIATTRRDLDQAVQNGRFREDLFHRLAVGRLELPPLRDRHGDIELLARTFCSQLEGDASQLSPELLASFAEYSWPGNVRELRNAVARRLVLGEYSTEPSVEEVEQDASPGAAQEGLVARGDSIARVLAMDLPLADARQLLVSEFDQRYTEHLLAQHGGNVSRAAAAAGVARRHLQRIKAKFRTPEE